MNYYIFVFSVVLVIAILTWFFEGKGNYTGYTGPKIEIALTNRETMETGPTSAPSYGNDQDKGVVV